MEGGREGGLYEGRRGGTVLREDEGEGGGDRGGPDGGQKGWEAPGTI